ncbi:MAG TPA: zinc-dependent metalloprotease family protein, partial [Phycisphaerales bacterium]|nr:zinc-dependent metalloprotease family protein [Phycisphaerales bacterium]
MKTVRNGCPWCCLTLLIVVLLGCMAVSARAQQAMGTSGPWSMLDRVPPGEVLTEPWVRPLRGQAARLDVKAMEKLLARAPFENSPQAAAPLVVTLPDPEGNWERFSLVEYSVMEAPLAAAHPELRTYRGEGIDDPYATIRCSLTPVGFQAQVRTPGETGPASGMWHIDAYTRGDTTLYMSYRHADAGGPPKVFDCQTVDAGGQIGFRARSTTGPTLRTYRLALALTGEMTVWAGGPAGGLTLATNVVNQLNGIYETELSVRFVLVGSETAIIYPDPNTDPFTNPGSSTTTNGNLQTALDATIGSANYDVGHVIHYSSNNNGQAGGIGTVCIAGQKGSGYTSYSAPNDPYFVIDYVAHELGHQFGGHHTHSNCGGTPGDSAQYLVEAGSGTTIMSYAGICGTGYNAQSHNDP